MPTGRTQNYFLLLILFDLLITNLAFSTQYYGNTKHRELRQHCYYEDLDLSIPKNETLRPTNIAYFCAAITCREDYVLVIKHCDRYILHQGCIEQLPDYTKPYPDCCPNVECP